MNIARILSPALLLLCTIPLASAENDSRGGKIRDISFDDIKFEMKKEDPFERSLLTPKIVEMQGTPIRIRGWIHPAVLQSKGIKQFVLVRDNMECCFGPGAALYDCIVVDMVEGESVTFTTRPIAVEGVFKVDELKGSDGKHLAIYHLDGQKVK